MNNRERLTLAALAVLHDAVCQLPPSVKVQIIDEILQARAAIRQYRGEFTKPLNRFHDERWRGNPKIGSKKLPSLNHSKF